MRKLCLYQEDLCIARVQLSGAEVDEPFGIEMKIHTASLSAEWTPRKNRAVGGEYDLLISKEIATGTSTTNNVLSLAVRYIY